jgi:hypothetical protein
MFLNTTNHPYYDNGHENDFAQRLLAALLLGFPCFFCRNANCTQNHP